MTNYLYAGSGGGNWNDSTNWLVEPFPPYHNGVPGPGDTAFAANNSGPVNGDGADVSVVEFNDYAAISGAITIGNFAGGELLNANASVGQITSSGLAGWWVSIEVETSTLTAGSLTLSEYDASEARLNIDPVWGAGLLLLVSRY
jgi:hypothetical protein